ncbi:MAG: class D beta-lactamase [Saprospiraceae bacterium]|nr:class D beta-lactamase [Saprospiraceae bacterium]
MITIKKMILLLILTVFGLTACQKKQTIEIRNDFKKYYDQFQVEGSFVLYDPQTAKYIFYNQDQYKQTFSPASTFKISRRVGGQKMKYWLDKTNYGNADTSGGIDRFWLTGGLRISPEQQIDFLKRLHDKKLPFSLRSTDIVKRIMITRDTLDYVIRAKKGWGGHESKEVGWYVGYIETNGNVYYFSNCIQIEAEKLNDTDRTYSFDHARKEIVFKILEELKLTSK